MDGKKWHLLSLGNADKLITFALNRYCFVWVVYLIVLVTLS